MRQTIQREVLARHFVPNTAGAAANRAADGLRGHGDTAGAGVSEYRAQRGPGTRRTLGRTMLRTGSTIFWALLSERVYAQAISQRRVSAALLGGSLAAGAAYAQERSLPRTDSVVARRAPRRSLFSFHALMGLGLGLGAMLANRRK